MPERLAFEGRWPGGKGPVAEQATAADRLAGRYFGRMVDLARVLIRRYRLQAVTDAEDAANVALYQLIKASARGGPQQTESGDDLWKLARLLVLRKLSRARRRSNRAKRGGSRPTARHEVDDDATGGARAFTRVEMELEGLQAVHVLPEEVVAGEIEVEHLIEGLGDSTLKSIVHMRLEGFTLQEIAEITKRDRKTISRKLKQIQELLAEPGREP